MLPKLTAVVVTVVGGVVLMGCGGPSRSVAAYCSYFYGEGQRLRQHWAQTGSNASQDPFGAIASAFAALPEAADFMHQLSIRAPEEIAPDVETLAAALKRLSEQAGVMGTDPLAALAGGLVSGLATSSAEQKVNAYTLQHCGPPPS
jgi:hypothetical protein